MGSKKENFYWSAVNNADEILDYKIVQGLPIAVEKEVKMLLAQDWQPKGSMRRMKVQDNDIIVQCMVLYKNHALC